MIKVTVIVPLYNNQGLIARCLDSLPERNDIEIIVINDCSSDNSLAVSQEWIQQNNRNNIQVVSMEQNSGVGAVINRGYQMAQGEYVMTVCDDDAIYTENFDTFIKELDGTDLVFYDMEINNGDIWEGRHLPGATKAYKKTIIEGLVRLNKDFGGDAVFYNQVLERKPSIKDTRILLYRYDYPRDGSLMDRWQVKKETEPREKK